MEWICAKDRLPEKDGKYLCAGVDFDRSIEFCLFSKNLYSVDKFDFSDKKKKAGFYNYDRVCGYYEEPRVTHWTELPDFLPDA